MKLKYLKVDGYKNLNECEIHFAADQRFNAVIGRNGSGKSNIIESLLQILIGVYFQRPPHFDFELAYETHRRLVEIRKLGGRMTIQVDGEVLPNRAFADRLRSGPAQVFYPELAFVYYSGECKRVRDLVKRYRRNFSALTRKPDADKFRPIFVQSANDQSQIILLALFAHRELPLLDIVRVSDLIDLRIVLRSPDGYDPKRHEPKLWNTEGAIKRIVAALDECSIGQDVHRPATLTFDDTFETFDSTRPESAVEHRTYYFNDSRFEKRTIHSLAERLAKTGDNVYSALEALNDRKLLVSVSYKLVGKTGDAFEFEQLSEGEKQLLAVIGAIRLSNQRDSLILLDEPDTHLNPNWVWEFVDLLKYALPPEQYLNTTVLLTTHNPVMISGLLRDQVWMADSNNDGHVEFSNPLRHPRGQGIANILCSSEFYGLPSSLDKETQKLMDERLQISLAVSLSETDKSRLRELNQMLEILSPGVSERDPEFVDFLRHKHGKE